MTENQTQRRRSYAGTFAEKAADLSGVKGADVDADRYPPRIAVSLRQGSVPPGVHDLLDYYQAEIQDVTAATDGLVLDVTVPDPWKDAGTRTIREHGNSLVLTLSREALDAAGLDAEQVDLHARDGEVHVKAHDGGPRFP